ncbi:unnamed protein product, partial [Brassica rapa subsp. trilocularis]
SWSVEGRGRPLSTAGRRWFGSRLVRFVVFLPRWLGCCLWRRAALPPSVWLGSEVCCCYVVAQDSFPGPHGQSKCGAFGDWSSVLRFLGFGGGSLELFLPSWWSLACLW